MANRLGEEKINKLFWEMSIPAIMGMLSTAILNFIDRFFVGKINPLALSGVGITMPVQILQMAIVLLIGVGSSTLVSIRLGENRKKDAESILLVALKYNFILLGIFAIIFVLFLEPFMKVLAVSEQVYPYAKPYISVIVVGGVLGLPGYALNNSLRAIGKAKLTMNTVLYSSLLNMVLDPIFIFTFKMGIAGAALATVISQITLTIYVLQYFVFHKDLEIHLKFEKILNEWKILKNIFKNGYPSFNVQILGTFMGIYLNRNVVRYGTDFDVAALTIISTISGFYGSVVYGIVQGNQPILGYNWGSRQYDRVKKTLELSIAYTFVLSAILFIIVQFYPEVIIKFFTDDNLLIETTTKAIKIHLLMHPLIAPQTIGSQYFQSVEKAKQSSILLFFRYGLVMIPAIMILAPIFKVRGIYMSNAVSDFIAATVTFIFVFAEIKNLNKLIKEQRNM